MATILLDNSSLTVGTTTEIRSGGWLGITQATVLEETGTTAGSLSVYVKRVGNPGDLLVYFYEVDSGTLLPTGAAFASYTLSEDDAVVGSFGWYSIDLGQLEITPNPFEFAIVLASAMSDEDHYWETEHAYLFPGLGWTDGSGWGIVAHGPAMILYAYEYALDPPAGRPTKKRLIGLAENALYYEDI